MKYKKPMTLLLIVLMLTSCTTNLNTNDNSHNEVVLPDEEVQLDVLDVEEDTISDLNYKETKAPNLRLISEKEFLNKNIDIKQVESEGKKNLYNKDVTVAKYLPSVSLTAGYNWDKLENPSFAGSSVRR